MIRLNDIVVKFGDFTALHNINVHVQEGEFFTFLGPSGCGKTTTLRMIAGLETPTSGRITIGDQVVFDSALGINVPANKRKVGFLFQNPDRQICCGTVREELLFGFKALDELDAQAEQRVDAIIERFGFDPDADPFLLNRGARQLLALASIVVLEPPVVVLDEPTTGLDFRECVKVMQVISQLHRAGTTVVMVCHDMEVVADFAERVIVMSEGRVVDQGPTFEVLRNPRTLEEAHLVPPQIVDISLALPLMDAHLAASPVAAADTLNEMQAAVEAMAGRAPVGCFVLEEAAERLQGAPGPQELQPPAAPVPCDSKEVLR